MNGITKIVFITILSMIGIMTTTVFSTISSALAQTSMSNATSGNATSGNGNDTSGRTSDLGRF